MAEASKVKILNIWADEQGISHFREFEIDTMKIPQGGTISSPIKAKNVWFRQTPQAQDMDWHLAPRRQFVITLSGGTGEITASDGEVRIVRPGEVVLVEDTFGKGHKSKAFDGLPRNVIFIEIEGDLK